jgi:hypothetical protein
VGLACRPVGACRRHLVKQTNYTGRNSLPGDLAVAAGPPSASAGLPLRWSRSRAAGSSRRSCDVSLAGWLAAEMNWLGVCQAESMGGSKQRSGHSGSRRPSRRSESEVGKFLRGEPKARETPKASETVDGGDDAVRHELEDFLETGPGGDCR